MAIVPFRNRDGRHSRNAAVCLRSSAQGFSGTKPERIEPIEMSENVWYYVASRTEDKETATLWMVLRDESGYTCRTWQLSGFDRRKIEAWMRMTEQRRSKGLAIDPPPDILDMTPEEAHFAKIHEARAHLGIPWDPTLRNHAAVFFRQIDPVKYPG